jgi:hypothetical protein
LDLVVDCVLVGGSEAVVIKDLSNLKCLGLGVS